MIRCDMLIDHRLIIDCLAWTPRQFIFGGMLVCLFVSEVCYPLMSRGDRRQRVNIWYSVRTTACRPPLKTFPHSTTRVLAIFPPLHHPLRLGFSMRILLTGFIPLLFTPPMSILPSHPPLPNTTLAASCPLLGPCLLTPPFLSS